jgi:hypothetical protein
MYSYFHACASRYKSDEIKAWNSRHFRTGCLGLRATSSHGMAQGKSDYLFGINILRWRRAESIEHQLSVRQLNERVIVVRVVLTHQRIPATV